MAKKLAFFWSQYKNWIKLIINQLWTWIGNSDESGFILKHIS